MPADCPLPEAVPVASGAGSSGNIGELVGIVARIRQFAFQINLLLNKVPYHTLRIWGGPSLSLMQTWLVEPTA